MHLWIWMGWSFLKWGHLREGLKELREVNHDCIWGKSFQTKDTTFEEVLEQERSRAVHGGGGGRWARVSEGREDPV